MILLLFIIFNYLINTRTRIVRSRSDCGAECQWSDREMFHSAESHPAGPQDDLLHLPGQAAAPLGGHQPGAGGGAGSGDLHQGQRQESSPGLH